MIPVAIPMPISWSMYKNYVECPAKFKAIITHGDHSIQHTHARTVGHLSEKVFQQILKQDWSLEECIVQLGTLLDTITKDTHFQSFDRQKVIAQVQNNLFESYDRYKDLFGPFVKTHELYTECNLGDEEIEGRIDVFFTKETYNILIDGKSSRHGRKFITRDQLDYYAFCHKRHFGRLPYSMYYFHYHIGEYDEIVIEESRFNHIMINLAAMKKDTTFERLTERSHACYFCPIKSSCVTACHTKKERDDSFEETFGEVKVKGFGD
jgi:hypothetical protein